MQSITRVGQRVLWRSGGELTRMPGRFLQRKTTNTFHQRLMASRMEAGGGSAKGMLPNWKNVVAVTAAGLYFSHIYSSNCQDDLKQRQYLYDGKLRLIDSTTLENYNGKSGGRSGGGYLTNGVKIFHDKRVFSEQAAINEMLVGNLIHTVCPELFPEVLAIQTIQDDGMATFALLSEVKPFAVVDTKNEVISPNLEELMSDATVPEKVGINLGVSIAAHAITGNTDTKLANIVYSDSCYPIDFENAGNQELVTFPQEAASSDRMIESITEYKRVKDNLSEQLSEDAQVESFDPHHPLMGNDKVLEKFRDWLVDSVKQDIENDLVGSFYRKLAGLNDQQLEDIIDGVPFLQRSPKAKDNARSFLKKICARAEQACKY